MPVCTTTSAHDAVNKVVDVPVIMRVEVPQILFIAGSGGHSSSHQRQVLGFQQWRFMAVGGVFWRL